MARDIATLGARLDPHGVLIGTRKANAALDKMALRGRKAATGLVGGFAGLKNQLFSLKGLIGTMGFGLLAKNLLGTGISFEHSMAKVGGIMNATTAQMGQLNAIAREMGETTEFKATQAAAGLEFLGMAGFEAEKAIAALPGVLDLATAGQIELGRAADITSNVLSAMRLPVEDLEHVNDTLIKTITTSNTNMDMLAESLKFAAPLAAGLGFELEDLTAQIGMLGSSGIQGSMAGTQLAFAMAKLDKGFKALGVSAVDAQGEIRGIADFLEELENANLGTEKSTRLLLKAFGQRGGRGMLALFGQGSVALRKYTDEIKDADGASKKLAATMRATTKGAFDELKSVLESIQIDAFSKDSSVLNITIRELSQSLRDNKQALVDFLNLIVKAAIGVTKLAAATVNFIGNFTEVSDNFRKLMADAGAMKDAWLAPSPGTPGFMEQMARQAEIALAEAKITGEEIGKALWTPIMSPDFEDIDSQGLSEADVQNLMGFGAREAARMTEKEARILQAAELLQIDQDAQEISLQDLIYYEGQKTAITTAELEKRKAADLAYAKSRATVTNSLIGLLQQFAGKSKAASIALIAIDKARAIAQITIDTEVAAIKTLASLPYPANLAAAASIRSMGLISKGLVLATGFAQAGSAAGGGGGGVGGGGGTFDSPAVTTPAGVEGAGPSITVNQSFNSLDLDDTNRGKILDATKELMDEILSSTNGNLGRSTVPVG